MHESLVNLTIDPAHAPAADTEEQAVQSMAQTSGWSVPGVTIDDVEVRRVAVAIP